MIVTTMDASNLWFFGISSAFCLLSSIFYIPSLGLWFTSSVFHCPSFDSYFHLASSILHLSSSIFSLSYSIGHHSSLVSRHPSLVYCLQSPIFFFHLSYPISHPLSSAIVHLSSSTPRLLSSVFYLLTFIWCY